MSKMELKGWIGKISRHLVQGWAANGESKPLELELYLNGKLINKTLANIKRPDLVKAGLHPTGKCGFLFKVRDRVIKDGSKIQVKYKEQNLDKTKSLKRAIANAVTIPRYEHEKKMDRFFFIHIPKTAGTSFKKMLEKQFDQKDIFPNHNDVVKNGGLYPNIKDIVKSESRLAETKLLLGHYPFLTGRILGTEVKRLAFLREPIERTISNIYHIKRNAPRFKEMTPTEIFESTGTWHFQNLQTRYLADTFDGISMRFTGNNKIGKPALEKAIENLETLSFVGITEKFDESIKILNQKFKWELGATISVNKSSSKYDIPDSLREIITKKNALDIALYEKGLELFEQQNQN